MSTFMLNDGVQFPDDELGKLRTLMGEKIGFIYDSDNRWIIICRVMGKSFNRNRIRIENKINVAHISGEIPTQFETNKFRLAQQFTKLAVQIDEV